MSATLTRFCIEGLHNRYTIDIPIRDNKLVLDGVFIKHISGLVHEFCRQTQEQTAK